MKPYELKQSLLDKMEIEGLLERIKKLEIELSIKDLQFLEKEKELIINTYWAGYNQGIYSSDKTAQEYYNETFLNK